MTARAELAIYTAAVRRAVTRNHQDRLTEDGICITCERRKVKQRRRYCQECLKIRDRR